MDTWALLILLFTFLAGLGTIVYWCREKIRALISLLRTSISSFGRPVTKNFRNFSAKNLPYAAAGKIGLAIVIANQYEGAKKLNGTAKDKERWEKVFKDLQFDVRTSGEVGLNASKEEMLRLCNLPREIPIRQKDVPNYRFIAFVFSGHGYRDTSNNDVIVSQDGKSLSLESEVFPCLFGGRRGDCIKLIFIDACRSDPSQGKLTLTKSHEKALKHSNPTVHPTSDFTDDAFIAFATLKGFPAEDDTCGSIFSDSFTNLLQTDISLVNAMTKVTEEVLNSPTQHYFRPMSVNMLSCEVNLYHSAKLVMGPAQIPNQVQIPAPVSNQGQIPAPDPNQVQIPAPVSNQGQISAPDPNEGQNRDMDQGDQVPVPNSSSATSTSPDTDGPGDREPQNSCPEPVLHDKLSTDEEIIPTSQPESDGGVVLSSQTGDPPVDEPQQNRSTDSSTDDIQLVTKSEAETIPSTPQPQSSSHLPSTESQTAVQTERDEPFDGLQVVEQHRNMGKSPQVSSDGRNMKGISPVPSFKKGESAPALDHHSNNPYVPQSTTMGSKGVHSKPHKGPNKLTIRALMPYIGELASLGLQISGWLDMSNEWAAISITPGTPGDHLQQLLTDWLNRDEDPNVPHTWEHFISVMRKCKRGKLAERMEREVVGSPGGLHSYHSEPAEVHKTSTTLPGPGGLHSYHSVPAEVHKTSTTLPGSGGLHSYRSVPAEVHKTSTTVPVLDSKPRESDLLKLVGSEMSADPPNLEIMIRLSGYCYIDQTTRHIQAVEKNFPSLKLTRKNFVHQNGVKEELASLCGTIPIHIQGSTYDIPVGIYLRKDYPHHCPTCLVQPTADMRISPSKYVNPQGMVSLPYLHDWKHTHGQSDLTTLIQIMMIAFSERFPVISKRLATSTLTDNQIRLHLSGYRHVTQTTRHIQAVLKNFPSLKLTRKNFVHQNGIKEELACLCGTIPVHIKGSTYDIPVGIYLRKDYPHHCPTCLVQPTSDMVISPSQYVNPQGMVSLPYLHDWKHSDLTTLIQIMSVAFSESSPVCIRPPEQQQAIKYW